MKINKIDEIKSIIGQLDYKTRDEIDENSKCFKLITNFVERVNKFNLDNLKDDDLEILYSHLDNLQIIIEQEKKLSNFIDIATKVEHIILQKRRGQ